MEIELAYAEDYYFIRSVMRQYGDRRVYLNQVAAHYNALQPQALARLLGSQAERSYTIVACVVLAVTAAITLLMK